MQTASHFARDQRGATALLFGLTLPLLAITAGVGVDMGRWIYAKRITENAVDAAVLAGARTLQLKPEDMPGALAVAKKYYDMNVTKRVGMDTDTISFIATDGNKAITATGAAYLKTTLLNVAGIEKLEVASSSGAGFAKASVASGGFGGSNIEVAVMLDVTGSMCNNNVGPCTADTKISGLKTAAKDLIDIVVSTDQSKYTSKVAIVPFSTRVRVGPDGGGTWMMKKLTDLDATWSGYYKMCTSSSGSGGSESGGNWSCNAYSTQYYSGWKVMPCVTDRFYDSSWTYDYTDLAPAANRWLNAHDGGRMTKSWDSSDTAPTTQLGTAAKPAEHWNFDDWGGCADVDPANEIMPLSADKAQLKAKIDSLVAYGSTAGALGTAFAWYTLSPEWKTIFTGQSQPRAYAELTELQANGAPKTRKVAVLMTDGGYNTFRGWKDQDQQEVSNYAKQLCTNMKAKGIEIYTVGFALNQLSATEQAIARATLQACGTDIKHFYETLTVTELQTAFQDIAVQLSSLKLSW